MRLWHRTRNLSLLLHARLGSTDNRLLCSSYSYVESWTQAHTRKQAEDTTNNDDEHLPKKENALPTTSAKHDCEHCDDAFRQGSREAVGEDSSDSGMDPDMPSLEKAEAEIEPGVRSAERSQEPGFARWEHVTREPERPRVILCHGIEGFTESEVCDIFERYNPKTIHVLGGCSCNVVRDYSTIWSV